ncbi:hypothetical protein [Ruminococcus sp.]|uniref:hypothetical protein n=1 Tax=Ruminococcus sp. TaxID=41978 RepID=UPI0025CD0A2D|nr:hypothetical protein [Ruminococcus sp.]MBQ8966910.1 hypothetical protein [Ruminococcus sp.]
MFKMLSRKLLGENYSSALKNLFISVFIAYGLYSIGKQIPLSEKVLVLTVIVFSGTLVIQSLGSADNAKLLRGLFAMPCDERRTLGEYTAVMGAYILTSKVSLLAVLFFSFTKMNTYRWVLFLLAFLYAVFGGMAAFGNFKKRPFISALYVAAGVAMAFLLPHGKAAVIALGAADIICAGTLFLLKMENFRIDPAAGRARKVRQNSKPSMLIPRYLGRYLLEHKSYIFSTVFIIGFAVFFAINAENMGLKFACGMGMAAISINSPVSTMVSANRGLDRKLDALPAKTERFFIPFGVTLFCFYLVCFGLFLAAFRVAGGTGGIRYIIMAPVFAAEGAFLTSFLENRYPIKTWKTEADLTHNPRKYILPIALMIEAALVGYILP